MVDSSDLCSGVLVALLPIYGSRSHTIIMIMMMHIQGVFFTEKNTLYMVPGHLLIIMMIIMIMMHIYGSRSNADDHDDDDAYTGCIFNWASP